MYSCLEHIEESMDRFLDEYGKLPILVEVEIEHKCEHCDQVAVYKVIEIILVADEDEL